jgi:small-conductance mechanosensitive channel
MTNLFNLILGIPTVLAQTAAATTEKTTGAASNILGFVFENLPLWITAVVFFLVSMVLGVILKNIVESRIASQITEEHQEILIISGRLTFVGVAVIGGTISLAIAGINVTNLIAAVGFGISFGLQDTIANFVAGIALLGSRPFTIGDWIMVNGKKGKVEQVRIRATYLTTYDGERLIVPNSQLYKSQVLSYTSNPMRRMKIPAYTRYNIDMQQAYSICLNVVKSRTDVLLQPKPNIVITEMGDYYIGMEVRFWVDSRSLWRRISSQVFMEIQNKFVEAGIDSPYPTNALAFDTDDDDAFIKTHSLTTEEADTILRSRQKSNEEFTGRREELVKPHFASMEEIKNLDKSGAAFLQVANMADTAGARQFAPQEAGTSIAQVFAPAAQHAVAQAYAPAPQEPVSQTAVAEHQAQEPAPEQNIFQSQPSQNPIPMDQPNQNNQTNQQ